MEIRKVLNGKYMFVNESKGTSTGFKHTSTLFRKDGYEIENNTCHYLNRTWESYTFQTSMRGCIYKLIKEAEKKAIDDYKQRNTIQRMSQKQKEQVLEEYGKVNSLLKDYRKIYKELEYHI